MDKIVDIPVKDFNGKIIGKASVENKGTGYYARITLDPELGKEMMAAMSEGMVTGLSIAPEILPATNALGVEPVPSFYQGRADYGQGPSRVSLPLRLARYPDQEV